MFWGGSRPVDSLVISLPPLYWCLLSHTHLTFCFIFHVFYKTKFLMILLIQCGNTNIILDKLFKFCINSHLNECILYWGNNFYYFIFTHYAICVFACKLFMKIIAFGAVHETIFEIRKYQTWVSSKNVAPQPCLN